MSTSTEIESITTERLLSVMADVVEEYGPDYVYVKQDTDDSKDCYYVPRPEFADNRSRTGCLIGEVLKRTGHLDVYRDVLDTHEPLGISTVVTRHIGDLFADRTTMHVAVIAQSAQDSGETWGQALDYARRTVPYLATRPPRYYGPTLAEIKEYQPPAA